MKDPYWKEQRDLINVKIERILIFRFINPEWNLLFVCLHMTLASWISHDKEVFPSQKTARAFF